MKLHLPKQLFTALLSAIVLATPTAVTLGSAAWAFTGPSDTYASGSLTDTDTSTTNVIELAPSEDTVYDLTSTTKKTFQISAKDYDIKLVGRTSTNDGENYLNNTAASTLWVAGGSFQIDAASDLSGAGDIHVGGGQLQFVASMELTNALTLGATSVNTGFPSLNVALRIGVWDQAGANVKLTGDIAVAENSTIGFQNGALLTLGNLSGSGDITLSRYDGSNSTLTLKGASSGYTGALNTSTSGVGILLGAASTTLGGITGSSALGLAEGVSASSLTLNVTGNRELSYSGNIGSEAATGISLVKSGTGTQTLSGNVYISDLAINGGRLNLAGTGVSINGVISNSGHLGISTTNATKNGSLLVSATGAGDITLSADAIVTQGAESQSTGNLTIQGGATLAIATEGLDHNTIKTQKYDLSSFSSVTLDDATIKYVGSTTELRNVTVAAGGASLLFKDMGVKVDNILGDNANWSWYKLTGTTTLNGDLAISKFTSGDAWKYAVDIDKLTGSGALNVTSGSEHGYVRVNDVAGYTGAITVTKSGGPAAVALRNLSGELGISGITLANGAEIYMDVAGNASAQYSGSLSGSGALKVSGGALTISSSNGSAYTGVTEVAENATLTIKNPKSLGSWNGMTASNVLGRVTGSGTLIIDFANNDTKVSAKGAGDSSSLGGFTGIVDIRKGQLYVGNNPNESSGADGDFGASRVIIRDGAQFWTHSSNATLSSAIDLLSGATLGNKDNHKTYTGNIRFNVVDPYAESVTYNSNGSVTLEQGWRKDLVYSGKLEGAGTVLMKAASLEEGTGTFKLTNNENTFSGLYKVVDSTSSANANRIAKLVLGGETVAQYADVELAGSKTISQLVLNQSSTIKGLYGSDADNIVTVEGNTESILTVSKGNFGGKLQDGSSAALGLMKTGEEKLTLSGVNISYTGLTTLADGELEITGSGALRGGLLVTGTDVKLTQSGENGILGLAGDITINENASAEFAGNIAIGSTISNNGTLTLNGQISITGVLTNFEQCSNTKVTYVQSDGSASSGDNGFMKVDGGYWLTSASSTGTTNLDITEGVTTVKHDQGGEYYLYKDDGGVGEANTGNYYFLVDSQTGTIFYVRNNDAATGNVEVNAAAAGRATGYELGAGTTMKLSEGAATNAGVTINAAGNSTINLAAGSTLHAFTKDGAGTITLTGSGTYDLGSGIASLGTGVSLGANWAGTVTLSGITSANGLDLNNFGNASSTVKLDGVNGWFARTQSTDSDLSVKTQIILGAGGISFDDYSTSGNYNFTKGISGIGNFVIDAKNVTVNASPTILIGANSTGTWSGAFQVNDINSNYVQLFLNGNGTYFDSTKATSGVEMNDAGGTLKVFVGYATPKSIIANTEAGFTVPDQDSSSGTPYVTTVNGAIKNNSTGSLELTALNNAVFNKEVVVTKFTVNSGKTATINSTLTAGSVEIAGATTIDGMDGQKVSMTKAEMSSTGISGAATDGTKGSMSNADVQIAQLAADASFTIEDMTLTNTTITAATVDTKVDLSNVSVGADSLVTLAKGAFTVQDQANVGRGGSACDFSTSSYSGFTLGAAGDASITLNLGDLSQVTAMGPGVYDITILLDGFQMTGDSASVLFASDSWLGKLLAQSNNANVEISISQVAAGEAAAAGGGASTGVSYSTGSVGTIITINGLNVPEPTTSTLSLLALAGLCARRRRK